MSAQGTKTSVEDNTPKSAEELLSDLRDQLRRLAKDQQTIHSLLMLIADKLWSVRPDFPVESTDITAALDSLRLSARIQINELLNAEIARREAEVAGVTEHGIEGW